MECFAKFTWHKTHRECFVLLRAFCEGVFCMECFAKFTGMCRGVLHM